MYYFYSTTKEIDFNKDTVKVLLDNSCYIVGNSQGKQEVDINKITSEVTKVCTYTAIGKSTEYPIVEADIVVGLPIGYYSKQKDEFKNVLMSYGQKNIIINSIRKSICIRRVEVFPQSAGLVFTNPDQYKEENTLVIDIGGMTVDVSYFKGMKLEKYSTYTSGMLKLYASLAQILNNKYEVNYSINDMADILLKKKIFIDGESYNINFLEETIDDYVSEFTRNIKTEYPVRIVNSIVLMGGGGIFLLKNIEKQLKNVQLLADAQFANANYFHNIGRMKFHD
ncbi:MAG TPA: ParM/StbA family protein [Candidatus Paceibacterota bacterium]